MTSPWEIQLKSQSRDIGLPIQHHHHQWLIPCWCQGEKRQSSPRLSKFTLLNFPFKDKGMKVVGAEWTVSASGAPSHALPESWEKGCSTAKEPWGQKEASQE